MLFSGLNELTPGRGRRGLRGRYSGNPLEKDDGSDRELGVMNPPDMDVREFVGIDDRNPIPRPPLYWALAGGDTDRTPVMERPAMTQSLMISDIDISHWFGRIEGRFSWSGRKITSTGLTYYSCHTTS